MEGHFLVRQIYDDEVTYNIVGAAERVLSKCIMMLLNKITIEIDNQIDNQIVEVPANILLEKFGEKFLDFCQDSGYDRILQVLGATPRDFLQVLNFLFDICIFFFQNLNWFDFTEFGRSARSSGDQ